MNDFKEVKKFWKFYSSQIKVKSDKSSEDTLFVLNYYEKNYKPVQISDLEEDIPF